MQIYIYLIRDPRTNDVRYVGQTRSPEQRLKSYKSPSNTLYRSNWHFYQFLGFLQIDGLKPTMEIVGTVSIDRANLVEQVWIHKMLDAGCELFNQKIMPKKKLDELMETTP